MEGTSSSLSSAYHPEQEFSPPCSPPESGPSSPQSVAEPAKIKIPNRLEIILHELVCLARTKGLFVTIPPCHPDARKIADEIASFIGYQKRTFKEIDYARKEALRQMICVLENVETEKLAKCPGYKRVMQALQTEYDGYSAIAANQQLEESGEVFQFIAHFPEVGHILNPTIFKIPNSLQYRYKALLKTIPQCPHVKFGIKKKTSKRRMIRVHKCKKQLRCNKCLKTAVEHADQALDKMDEVMMEESYLMPAGTVPEEDLFENFEMGIGISLTEMENETRPSRFYNNAPIKKSIGTFNGYCIDAVNIRQTMFQLRLRQQQLTTRGLLYGKDEDLRACEEIGQEIEDTARKYTVNEWNAINEQMTFFVLNAEAVMSLKNAREKMEAEYDAEKKEAGTAVKTPEEIPATTRSKTPTKTPAKSTAKSPAPLPEQKSRKRSQEDDDEGDDEGDDEDNKPNSGFRVPKRFYSTKRARMEQVHQQKYIREFLDLFNLS